MQRLLKLKSKKTGNISRELSSAIFYLKNYIKPEIFRIHEELQMKFEQFKFSMREQWLHHKEKKLENKSEVQKIT